MGANVSEEKAKLSKLLDGLEWLGFSAKGAITLKDLPFHHTDPSDRILVAQCLTRDFPLMTDDGKLAPHGRRLL